MPIGTQYPPEWTTTRDILTGRMIRQYTASPANNYPLYYFTPSITPEKDRLVFHSERTGSVQLHCLDLSTGFITQLTDGRTDDSNWKIWCPRPTTGIYDHLSVLNGPRREVIYFQDEDIRITHLDTLKNRQLQSMGPRYCISQNSVSPDGRLFAFAHVDREHFRKTPPPTEWSRHQEWRNYMPATISFIDLDTGDWHDVVALDFHIHHVIFLDPETLLINHTRNRPGMWVVRLDGSGIRTLRPMDEHGRVVHQVVTAKGIFYEAADSDREERRSWFGCYDTQTDTFSETELPFSGYVHTGFDPLGEITFFEHQLDTHQLVRIHHFGDPERQSLEILRTMSNTPGAEAGQYCHAHPFMSTDRNQVYYTEVIKGKAQIRSVELT
jgi:hypothetical protein